MAHVTAIFNDGDVQELNEIVMDKDKDGALKFLKEKVLAQIVRNEKAKLDVKGKRHL
jgi:hypothetical protein